MNCMTGPVAAVGFVQTFVIGYGPACLRVMEHDEHGRQVWDCENPAGSDDWCIVSHGSYNAGECPEGVGGGKFYGLMKDVRDPYRVVDVTQRFYKLGYHIAYNMANMAINGGIFLVSSIPDDTVIDMFITPTPSIEFAVDRAFKIKGKDAKILILTYGSLTVPVLKP